MDVIYVYLKPGIDYSDGYAIKLKKPKIEGDYLYGLSGNTERSIAVEDIEWIEVLRLDQKKVIIATSVIVAIGVAGVLYKIGLRRVSE